MNRLFTTLILTDLILAMTAAKVIITVEGKNEPDLSIECSYEKGCKEGSFCLNNECIASLERLQGADEEVVHLEEDYLEVPIV